MVTVEGLSKSRWQRVPVGDVQPEGWLKLQMTLQTNALTSHLPLFWPNVANSTWIGGFADVDGGLHENLPYWMNGAVPLAVQLGDTKLFSTIEGFLDIIFKLQQKAGWIGPDTDRSDFWSRMPFLMALAQYHESLPASRQDRKELCESVAFRFFMQVEERLREAVAVTSWSSFRVHDLIWSIHYFVDLLPMESEKAQWMLDVAAILHSRSFSWNRDWFNSSSFPQSAVKTAALLQTHGVNNAQAVKHGVVWGRQSGDAAQGYAESWLAWSQLQRFHGQPHGAFGADEHLAGRMPSRGTELCAVVEAMWSLVLVAQGATKDDDAVKALDALEVLAFNALPGSLSDDLWSHPYLQMANSFQALSNEPDHIWANDGPQAAMYGLEPNYPCCTSNFHQGYPKFAANLFFERPENKEIISGIWAPSSMQSHHIKGLQIQLKTGYPFGTDVEYWIQNQEPFVLKIRIPEFLRRDATTLKVWQEGYATTPKVQEGFMVFNVAVQQRQGAAIRFEFDMEPVVTSSTEGSTVRLGPLLMALDLEEQRHLVQQHPYGAADWDTVASQPWRMALPQKPIFGAVMRRSSFSEKPLQHELHGCPLHIEAQMVEVTSEWPEMHMAPGPPKKVHKSGQMVNRTLLPYACTSIRISAFPSVDVEQSQWV